MRIVLLGPPGAGKGSLASLFAQRLRLAHLSTGEIFRHEMANGSALGRRVKRYVSSGRLVPDSLVVQVMTAQLGKKSGRRGFVLDGFPRTERQARGLDRVLLRRRQPIDAAILLTSPEALLIRRLSGRRVCAACGANYHLRTMRPKMPGRCDRCRGTLVTRKDDQPATIRKRLAIDHKEAKPLVTYYARDRRLYRVDGRGRIGTVFVRAMKLIRRMGWWHDRAQNRRRA